MAAGAAEPATRFFDSRAAYMMFVTTTNEKFRIAERVARELAEIRPKPPGLRILDAGMGDATVISHVMRSLHQTLPHVPWLIVGKEISIEDVRQTLEKLPDRFLEHPELVFVVTNLYFHEVARLHPTDGEPVWREVALEGATTQQFTEQIRALYPSLAEDWAVTTSTATGNPRYVRPAVLMLYRADRRFVLDRLVPRSGAFDGLYDLVLAAQPYRARTAVERKVRLVIVPLARALAPGGRLVGVHARGDDPGLEIIRRVWPDEQPFPHNRHDIFAEARQQFDAPGDQDLEFAALDDQDALIQYDLHAMPSEEAEHIGTSAIVAAWNAAAYVAQIDEPRLSAALASGAYVDATREVARRHGEVWFNDEVFLITRRPAAP